MRINKKFSDKKIRIGQAISRIMPFVIQGIHMDFVSKHPITHRQFLVLVAIHAHGSCGMNVLSSNLHVAMPTATGIVERLVTAGYVNRLHSEQDRRQVLVQLSKKGENFIHNFQKAVAGRWAEILNHFPDHEIENFASMVLKIEAALLPNPRAHRAS